MTEQSTPRYPFVHVDTPPEAADETSLWLFELGALGVEERDGTTFTRSDDVAAVTLVGSFADEETAQAAQRELVESYPARVVFVEDDDWRDGWKAHFKPTRVGQHWVIRPSWEPFEPAPDDVVLTLDPGGAFGTGTHESTRLVLELLETTPVKGLRLLDVGCGSGILAIGALLLGGREVVAIDVDDASVDATLENAEVNGVGGRIAASKTPLAEIEERFPLVLSNIEAHVLIPLAEAVAARVQPGGHLILSGILVPQAESVIEAYQPLRCIARKEQGEWVALSFEKDSDG